MRNPDRIQIALEVIKDEWSAHPDLRLGQLLVNILELKTVDELFNLEDKTLVTRIAERPGRRDRVMDRLSAEIERMRPHAARLLGRDKIVYDRAMEIFKDDDKTKQWLESPCFALGNQVPAQLINSDEGFKLVLGTLGRPESEELS